MDPEYVISLFDSCWFGHKSFIKHSTKSISEENTYYNLHQENSSQPMLSKQSSILLRSKSDQLSSMTSFNYECSSPASVLIVPHLQTINSGKEVKEDEEEIDTIHACKNIHTNLQKNIIGGRRRRRKLSNMSKSLSELEFEELKGFMDLGFVFSEKDKDDLSLVEIIPGLHRLGQNINEENDECKVITTRPYLSEAWEVMEEEKRIDALVNWRIPAPKNEIHMKDSLKCWAHTVASAVR